MKVHRLLVLLLLFILAPARAQVNRAHDSADEDRVQAAHDNAIQLLLEQVSDVRLQHHLTIGDLLTKTGAEDELEKTLDRAQQVGGARWLDQQTCQVRLEISGRSIASALQKIVANHAAQSPLSADALAVRLPNLESTVFCAVGTSTGSQDLVGARFLGQADGWSVVSDDARRQAILGARRDAISRIFESVRAVALTNASTVGDAMNVPAVHASVEQWLASRPVTRLEYLPDLQVKLTLSVPADDLFDTFESAAKAQKKVQVPATADRWEGVRTRFVCKLHHPSGRATAAASAHSISAVSLPDTAPDWVARQLNAQGSSKPKSSRLKAARAAETSAIVHLRAQAEALPLTSGVTIGEAERRDPRIAQAVSRVINDARTYKVDYEADGSARVKVNLDLRDLWDELQSLP